MTLKMQWCRKVIGANGKEEYLSVVRNVEMGTDGGIFYKEPKKGSWFGKELKELTSSVPISQYILSKGKVIILLMEETLDGELIPLVSQDRTILTNLGPILKTFTQKKDEEIAMLNGVIDTLQENVNEQLKTYYETYQRILKGYNSLGPLLMKSLLARFDLFRQYVRNDYSEHDHEVLMGRLAREIEAEFLDRFKQDKIDDFYTKTNALPPFVGASTSPTPRRRVQKSPRKEAPAQEPTVDETRENFSPEELQQRGETPFPAALNRSPSQPRSSPQMNEEEVTTSRGSNEDIDDLLDAWRRGEVILEKTDKKE
jgi:hypothetical protein